METVHLPGVCRAYLKEFAPVRERKRRETRKEIRERNKGRTRYGRFKKGRKRQKRARR